MRDAHLVRPNLNGGAYLMFAGTRPAKRRVSRKARRAPNRSSKSAEGSGPDWRVVGAEFGRKLVSRVDLQFAEGAREVTLDCARRNEKGLCDFAVGEALAGELGDAALAGGE